ncbi:hypothetical protein QBC34DRAFT_437433 [Podospora aff. communis PSN243]|uniref:Uncharacterized protein n=1 Tax=Podospora aff. communis PSN243 TaxID=3040156 RepID=A0AAV9GPJ3_9PEZI|nr:hypothetical protein QBC34DRAFT_437433 [Podospora aff. communis PSN243]
MQLTTFAIAAAALAGHALAIGDCVPGRFYCGFTFLDSQANIARWRPILEGALDAAHPPVSHDLISDTLYICQTTTSVIVDEACPLFDNKRCQPKESSLCGGPNGVNACCAK